MTGVEPAIGLERIAGRRQAGHQLVHRQRLENHARREGQHLVRLNAQHVCHCRTGGLRSGQTGLTGACVGHAGIDHQCTNSPCRQVGPANLHRCGTKTVLGEYTGNTGARSQFDEREIPTVELADGRLGHAKSDTGNRQQGSSIGRGKQNGHDRNSRNEPNGKVCDDNPGTVGDAPT